MDLKISTDVIAAQFRGLGERPPGQWPLAPRLLCGLAVVLAVSGLGYYAYWMDQFDAQEAGAAKEEKLRAEYTMKMNEAINLEALRAQKVQVDLYVDRLQKQLPSKAEMAALLSDINQAGQGRGLQFELFKPGQTVVKDYYAELPIEIRITGNYHDVGSFAGDMASLPRIVTLNNMSLATGKTGGLLTLEAVAKTFRYLDKDELDAQRQAMADKRKGKVAKP